MSIDDVYALEPDCPECGEAQDEPPGGWLDGEELTCACGEVLQVMQDDSEQVVYLVPVSRG